MNIKKEILCRRKNSIQAAKILGIKKCFFFSYPDNKLDKAPLLEITQKIEKIITTFINCFFLIPFVQ